MLDNDEVYVNKLLKQLKNSYAPYSNFYVAALIVKNDGSEFFGSNIENASYGATICAERSVIVSYLSQGNDSKDIKRFYIMTSDKPTPPCCLCRQVMLEFLGDDIEIILCSKDKIIKTNIKKLVPMPFVKESL